MPQVVADVLEGQPLAEQPRRAGMAERVRPVMPQLKSTGAEHATREVVEACAGDRPVRRFQREKHFTPAPTGTYLGDVAQ